MLIKNRVPKQLPKITRKMADKTVAIYCLFDDIFKVMGPKTDPHCKLNDAEIATIAVIAAISFYGNQAAATLPC